MVSLRRQHSWLERYDVSQMRFYEFYAMGVPIFLPGAAVRGQDRNGLASSTTADDEILA